MISREDDWDQVGRQVDQALARLRAARQARVQAAERKRNPVPSPITLTTGSITYSMADPMRDGHRSHPMR